MLSNNLPILYNVPYSMRDSKAAINASKLNFGTAHMQYSANDFAKIINPTAAEKISNSDTVRYSQDVNKLTGYGINKVDKHIEEAEKAKEAYEVHFKIDDTNDFHNQMQLESLIADKVMKTMVANSDTTIKHKIFGTDLPMWYITNIIFYTLLEQEYANTYANGKVNNAFKTPTDVCDMLYDLYMKETFGPADLLESGKENLANLTESIKEVNLAELTSSDKLSYPINAIKEALNKEHFGPEDILEKGKRAWKTLTNKDENKNVKTEPVETNTWDIEEFGVDDVKDFATSAKDNITAQFDKIRGKFNKENFDGEELIEEGKDKLANFATSAKDNITAQFDKIRGKFNKENFGETDASTDIKPVFIELVSPKADNKYVVKDNVPYINSDFVGYSTFQKIVKVDRMVAPEVTRRIYGGNTIIKETPIQVPVNAGATIVETFEEKSGSEVSNMNDPKSWQNKGNGPLVLSNFNSNHVDRLLPTYEGQKPINIETFTDPVHKAGEITAIVCLVICIVIFGLLITFFVIIPKSNAKKMTTEITPASSTSE